MSRVISKTLFYHYGDAFNDYGVQWLDEFGAPISLAGFTAAMRIKAKAGGGTSEPTLLQLDSTDGLSIDAPNGKVTVNATAAKMKGGALPVSGGVLYYDLQVKSPTGDPTTLLRGEFWIDPEVTTD